MIVFALILAVIGGTINRLRGWGNGWNGTNGPAWLMWAQSKIFNRPILSAVQALILAGAAYHLGAYWQESAWLWLALFAGWWLGVAPGWGEYFDGQKYQNSEIRWIDNLAIFLSRLMPASWATSAPLIDNISMGFRGVYYLPMQLAAGIALHSWWFALPALFFWQDGVIYGFWRKVNPHGDFVRQAEITGGAFRVFLISCAIWLSV